MSKVTSDSPVVAFGQKLLRFGASINIGIVILILLLLITWLGTEAQPEKGLFLSQELYFNSLIVFHEFQVIPITLPLPGAKLLLAIFAINLICGGIVMIRKSWRTAGVMVAHFSMLFLLAGGLLQHWYAEDGYIQLYEGETSDEFVSYHNWVIRVLEVTDGKADFTKEAIVLPPLLVESVSEVGEKQVDLPGVPFNLKLYNHLENATVMPAAFRRAGEFPEVDGVFARKIAPDPKNEGNVAATYIDVIGEDAKVVQSGILWGQELQPLTVNYGERTWLLKLDRERWSMPFAIQLDEFRATFHPNGVAATYESDVTKIEDGASETRLIEMNEPLRDHGYIVFQSGYGPQDERGRLVEGQTPYSVFAVWKNPTSSFLLVPLEHWPLVSVSIAALGMGLHFLMKLIRHLSSGTRPRPSAVIPTKA